MNAEILTRAPFGTLGRGRRRARPAGLWARLRAPWLDRQLAAGVSSWHSRAHAARALQLTTHRTRRRLARVLEQLVERAEDPPRRSATLSVPRVVRRSARRGR
jgi:hypothetical protein